ncbi:hypothetical protein M3N64_07410 [Sporolactobacillus sp. CPB3-1]|uniref:Major facilitator superfamily (MFS) profile domain-containing protein n=1 Tax=Sporolactobacillus mangiferae TaxID=2940498 RepID=A0ABT0MA86_9BACL|nr:hypothetical protein [Sporolactobacillus mangiferae]MCL1631775.1 hypothetical protein [Sporolactobacillus mangiferae]
MIISYLQLLLCYALIGMLMGSLLGLLPFWRAWQGRHIAVFFLFLIAWLPVIMLAFICAPLANGMRVQESDC